MSADDGLLPHVTLTGRVTRDPEVRRTLGGYDVAGTEVEVVDARGRSHRFNVTAWRDLALNLAELASGARVTVTGRLVQQSWVGDDATRRSALEIVATDVALSMRVDSEAA